MTDNYVTFLQNPNIDILFGYMGTTIPSKKEDFKPLQAVAVDDSGNETIVDNFYVRKPSSKSVVEFENLIREQILTSSFKGYKILKPALVEVVITVTLTKSKFFDIDLDNIAKTVLDSIKGYLFEDDSQVVNLICRKDIHPKNMQGFFIAVTEFKDNRGILSDIYLFSEKKD